VTLVWNLVSGATGYSVLRKLQGESAFRSMTPAPAAGPPYQDNTPLPPGRHEYQVQAVDGTPTPAIPVTMGPWPAPTALSLELNDRRATLVWNAIPGVTAYQVFRQGYLQPAFQLVGSPTDRWFVEENLSVGLQQYYVAAVGGDQTNPMSVLVGKPKAGARIYRGSTTFDLGWFGGSLATGFNILQGPTAAGPWANVTSQFEWPTPTLARFRTANPAVTLYYKVVASYAPAVYPPLLIESDPVEVTFPKPPQGPANFTARAAAWDPNGAQPPTQFVVHLSWTCDPEAVGYMMMVGRSGQGRGWIMGYGGRPLQIKTCNFGAGPVTGAIGDAYDYAVIAVYPDPDTVAEASMTVRLAP
jgi:hypothetical protein